MARKLGEAFVDVKLDLPPATVAKLRTEVAAAGDVAGKAAGEKGGRSLADNMTQTVRKQLARPDQFKFLSAGVLAPAIAAASPAIAVAIAGAVTTGVGLGFLGAGALALKGNKEIVAAARQLKSDLGQEFTGAAQPLAGPFVDAIHIIDQDLKSLGPGLRSTFAALGPAVAPLAQGLGGFVREVMPGLESAAKASVPLLTELGHQLPGFGAALGTLIKDLGDSAPQAIKFLKVSFTELDGALVILGGTMKFLSGLYGAAFDFWHGFGIVLHDVKDAAEAVDTGLNKLTGGLLGNAASGELLIRPLSTIKQSMGEAAAATQHFGAASGDTSKALADLQSRMTTLQPSLDTVARTMTDSVINALMGIDRANIAVAASLNNVTATLKSNKDALDIHKAAGQADRGAILDAVAANVQLYDAQINSGISAQDAAAAYDANTRALVSQLKKAGLTAAQIDGLIGKYKSVPRNVNTLLALQGLTDAINGLKDVLTIINKIPRQKLVTVRIQTFGSAPTIGSNVGHRAGGGRVSAGAAYVVGEYRPELFVPDVDGTVMPRVPSGSGTSATVAGPRRMHPADIRALAEAIGEQMIRAVGLAGATTARVSDLAYRGG